MSAAARQFLLGLALLCLSACGSTVEYRGPADVSPPPSPESDAASFPMDLLRREMSLSDNVAAQQVLEAIQGQEQDRLMIYTASMSLEVARVDDSIARCLDTVRAMGGYLSRRANSTLTVRIPTARFQNLLGDLRAFGRILSESMQASDVTRQHVDLGIRLENARRSRDRLLTLLEKAEQVEDMLKIETELRRLTTEIEQMEGELKFLEDQVALSTVSVTFQAVASQPPGGPRKQSRFPWINMTGAEYVLRWF